MKNAPLIVAGIVFGLVALMHLLRLYYQYPIFFNTTLVPLWANVVGFLISGALSFWMFYSAECTKCKR